MNIQNEFNKLKKVLMCSPKGFVPPNVSIDPQTEDAIKNGSLPTTQELIDEQGGFAAVLNKNNVEIVHANLIPNAIDQMFTRDPYFAIGDKFVVGSMKEKSRAIELPGINGFLSTLPNDKIIHAPKNIVVEGGDVMPHNGKIFVGQGGLRTDAKGLEWLKRTFGDKFDVIPINLQPNSKGQMLHVDCAFNIMDNVSALVNVNGVTDKSLGTILQHFPDIIEVKDDEQFGLGTNAFSISDKVKVMQSRHERLIGEVQKRGKIVEAINGTSHAKLGGAWRCTTCPIERESK
jgi:N-dimethylarginine dimethylaminohydrolase